MQNISGFGLRVNIIASVTFPTGITVSQFADDTDPFDLPSLQVADGAMGLNGDLAYWSKANPLKISLGFIPDCLDDSLLQVILNANRVGRGKNSANDIITMTATYASGGFVTLNKGIIVEGPPSSSVSAAGRKKSKVYNFMFENVIGFSIPGV